MKGETVEEVAAAARVMRELSARVDAPQAHLVDTCGTGGDGAGIFNVSTAAAIVAAAAGAKVAKHGNRSVTSKSGSADVLEAAGVKIGLTPEQVSECITKCGVGFMFAPAHHSAMKHAIGPRREMGVRTIFNVLGPLTNPASAPNQVLGVFDRHLLEPMAQVLQKLGSRHVMVVHAADGLDEISIAAATDVAELKDGRIKAYTLTPEELGCSRGGLDALKVPDAAASLSLMRRVFDGEQGPALDIVALNAGAAIYVCGLTDGLRAGVEQARRAIADGRAGAKFAQLIEVSSAFQ
jgi:anthranilate phosphoribosyltransferase